MDLNKLAKEAFETAKAHGWHDEKHSDEHCLMLIVTEIAEAVNADRKSKYAQRRMFEINAYTPQSNPEQHCKFIYDNFIKDSMEDELSDVVIRCLSLAGMKEIDLGNVDVLIDDIVSLKENKSFIDLCYMMSGIATCDIETDEKIRGVIVCVLAYCRFRRIDIEWFIEQKMKYNRLRPYMHGGLKY